jgi:hypothetical protein
MRRRSWVIFAIAVVAAGAFVLWPRGVKTIVRNAGRATMRDVRVVVTGASHPLGDIRPNESRSVRVVPGGESDVTIRYTDGAGASKAVRAGCYIEHGYSGSVRVDVPEGGVVWKTGGIRSGRL